MVRKYLPSDEERLREIHTANGLPEVCFPDLSSATIEIAQVVEYEGKPVLAAFLRKVGEAYLIVDHTAGTAEWRWAALKELTEKMADVAFLKNFADCSVWVPDELADTSFAQRLEDLGFKRSPWVSFTRIV